MDNHAEWVDGVLIGSVDCPVGEEPAVVGGSVGLDCGSVEKAVRKGLVCSFDVDVDGS